MKPNGKVVPCKECNTSHYRQKHQLTGNHFCSRACYASFKKGQDLGGWIKVECYECKQEFKKQRYLYKNRINLHHFCTHQCYSSYKAQKGNTPYTGATKPEKYLKKVLQELKTNFISQKLFTSAEYGRCYYDFYLPDTNTVIEVDGDYWHGNPKIYPTLNEQQQKCKIRDRQKELVLKQKNVILIRVWESELYTLTKQEIADLLNSNKN